MARDELLALSIFLSYFLLIGFLFILILRSLWRTGKSSKVDTRTLPQIRLFSLLTVGSFVHTWLYMIRFLLWSFKSYESSHNKQTFEPAGIARLTSWLMNSELFEQAWSIVCQGPMNWWWSEKLCLYTVGFWTIFLATEGRARHIAHVWAYMLLGQVVAISVASNLFYVALLLSTASQPPSVPQKKQSPPAILWFTVFASLITVARSPYTTDKTFLPNLLAMHAIIVIPLIYPMKKASYDSHTIHTAVALVTAALHTQTTIRTFLSLPQPFRSLSVFAKSAWQTVHSHPAQSSITWDVIWTLLSLALWLYLNPLRRSAEAESGKGVRGERMMHVYSDK